MKKLFKNVLSLLVVVLFLAGISETGWATPFQNGDFETGDFTGWSGEIGYYDNGNLVGTTVDPDSSDYFNLFHTPNPDYLWTAEISLDDTYYHNALYQDFTLDALNGPGWTMDITFWISWSPTNPDWDGISVTLEDAGGNQSINLLDGVSYDDLTTGISITQDITSFAQSYGGQDVELAFTIWDWDFNTDDVLIIDNISFQQRAPAPVPEPSTVVLLGFGLAGIVGLRKKRVR